MSPPRSSMEVFEAKLKEAVHAKQLSVSSMNHIQELAMKNMHHDTQLVSIMYRTHKSLSPAHKVNSLYVFDKLTRAAKRQVDKQGLTGDLNQERGNCATFLMRVDPVLDGLLLDTASAGPEQKEKVKKIMDIWVKSNTFPSAVLARLRKLVKESAEKDPEKVNTPPATVTTVDPRLHSHSAAPAPPQAAPVPLQIEPAPATPSTDGVQATLLALLQAASAAAASNGQTTTNIPPHAATSQPGNTETFAFLQQLAQAPNAGTNPTQPIPVPVSSLVPSSAPPNAVPPVTAPLGGPSQPVPHYRDDRNGFARREPQYDKYGGADRGREYHDDRRDSRGPYRGGYKSDFRGDHRGDHRGGYRGAFRGRGRGRWDDHDRRSADQDWGQAQRYRSGRSRSPPHARFARGSDSPRPDSPPQLPLPPPRGEPVFQTPVISPATTSGMPVNGKDEFGRDLRPASPDNDAPPTTSTNPPPPPAPKQTTPPQLMIDTTYHAPEEEPNAPAPIPTVIHSPSASAAIVPGPGLESIDLSTFDLTAPSSWEALARAWEVSRGYMPNQEELMQFIMAANMASQAYAVSQFVAPQDEQWAGEQGWGNRAGWGGGRGRGRGRGYRGYGYGNGRGRNTDQGTDALTLTGGDDDTNYAPVWQNPSMASADLNQYNDMSPTPSEGGGARTGKMQRVGDKWVFVKEGAVGSEAA